MTRKAVDKILKENKLTAGEVFLLQVDRELNYTVIKKESEK